MNIQQLQLYHVLCGSIDLFSLKKVGKAGTGVQHRGLRINQLIGRTKRTLISICVCVYNKANIRTYVYEDMYCIYVVTGHLVTVGYQLLQSSHLALDPVPSPLPKNKARDSHDGRKTERKAQKKKIINECKLGISPSLRCYVIQLSVFF